MKTVTVYDVQHNFSKVLAQIDQGETVIVSRYKIPVAKLVPIKKKSGPVTVPDFKARLQKIYGDKIVSNSDALIAEGREDRF